MTLTEMVSEVISLTGLPHLEPQIVSNLRAATLNAHSVDFFPKDLVEAIVSNPTPTEYKISITNPTRFRSWNYIRYCASSSPNDQGLYLKEESASNLLTSYNIEKAGIYYNAGTATKLILQSPTPNIAYGYFQYPDTSVNNFNSWIADEFPYYLIFTAASKMFSMVGRKDMAGYYASEASAILQLIIRDNITSLG